MILSHPDCSILTKISSQNLWLFLLKEQCFVLFFNECSSLYAINSSLEYLLLFCLVILFSVVSSPQTHDSSWLCPQLCYWEACHGYKFHSLWSARVLGGRRGGYPWTASAKILFSGVNSLLLSGVGCCRDTMPAALVQRIHWQWKSRHRAGVGGTSNQSS